MKCAILLVLLVTGVVHAQDQDAPPPARWTVELREAGVPADGRHIGLAWHRDRDSNVPVVVFRRVAPANAGQGGAIHVVDQLAQIVPSFMYPDTFKTQYYPAFDASQHAIPRGTKLGVWTVAGSYDGDAPLWIDEVDPGQRYVYALVPGERGAAPDTYESLEGSAVVTPPVAPRAASLWQRWWFRTLLIVAGAGVLAGGIIAVKRRRRAGATPPAEAS
jgi:hypothetical protein